MNGDDSELTEGGLIKNSFDKAKMMVLPRDVLAGHGVIQDTTHLCDDLRFGKNACIISGKMTGSIAAEPVSKMLIEGGYTVRMIEANDATETEIQSIIRTIRKEQTDFIIGVGGGSKIDIAKVAAVNLDMPFVSIPTSASHDGMTSPRATIISKGITTSFDAKAPIGIVADTAILVQAPYRMLASGCADLISNYTAIRDWQLAHRLKDEEYSSSAAVLAEISATMLLDAVDMIKPGSEDGVWKVVRSLLSSGVSMCIAQSSRPASGSEHKFAHALASIAPGKGMHGELCGIGAIMMMYLHDGDWQSIRDFLTAVGAPTTGKALGISDDELVSALIKAHSIRPERYTILGEDGLSVKAAKHLARNTGVI